jgi:methionyl-tRNA formyltransferase
VSYAHKLTRADAHVNWELPAHIVDRHIRGVTPAPGAWTVLPDGTTAKIGPVRPRPGGGLPPGQVRTEGGEVLVGTGTNPVALTTIAPAGRSSMDAAAWWRGARFGDTAVLGEA